MSKKLKPKKDSLIALTRKFASNSTECIRFFFSMKWPTGFFCEKCGCTHFYFIKRNRVFQCQHCKHQHYLLAGTIFQDCKLDLYTLILGMYLFFVSNKGISAIELASQLDVNYKTALLLARKCRILMAQSNSEQILDSMFYEADTAYIGAKSKEENKQGVGTEQQSFLCMLSTKIENQYPQYIKLHPIPKDQSNNIEKVLKKSMILSKDRKLNTDGKTTFQCVKEKIELQSQKIIYKESEHRLKWLNIIIGNTKTNIQGIYKGVEKRDLPLFLNEQEWRFNHRNIGNEVMKKIQKYLFHSSPMTKQQIITVLNLAEPYFTNRCI